MKRKTNLFYTSGPDSKFITFSNYTECLTGNFLSLESKLFPDKFLCLKINGLNSNTKEDFIKYIAAYYENKLAILRDYNVDGKNNVETGMLPLSYLLDAIVKVLKKEENGEYSLFLNNIDKDNLRFLNDIESSESISNLITYIGEITEQDYNGTYTDTICTIDLSSYNEATIYFKDNSTTTENKISASYESDKLYGWENDNLTFEDYSNVNPIYDYYDDNIGTYFYSTELSKLKLNKIDETDLNNLDKVLNFNIIIPLFSLVNKNINHENWSTYIIDPQNYEKYIDLEESVKYPNAIYDVPLGMWIHADEEEDTFIELKKDKNLNMYPSWSLLISSQFKPFPYSNKLTNENYTYESSLHAHATYSEVLTKVNDLIDVISTFNNALITLNNKVTALDYKVNNMGTEESIAQINQNLLNTETRINNTIDDLKQKFYGYINNITWNSGDK